MIKKIDKQEDWKEKIVEENKVRHAQKHASPEVFCSVCQEWAISKTEEHLALLQAKALAEKKEVDKNREVLIRQETAKKIFERLDFLFKTADDKIDCEVIIGNLKKEFLGK